jgi:glucose dehydrogenase
MKMQGYVLIFAACGAAYGQVPYQRIAGADSNPGTWVTYSGNYQAQRFTQLDQINKQNVAQLKPSWIYQMRNPGIVETSPIVADGIMYITEPPSTATALDLHTGRPLWTYTPKIPTDVIIIGSPPVNRGVAILDNTVYFGTVNCHLIALDAKTGIVRWDVAVDDNTKGYYVTGAPLAIDGKIIVGI